jgi:hypothetical protein
MEFDELSNRVIGCAIEVHRVLRGAPRLREGRDGLRFFTAAASLVAKWRDPFG